MNIISASDRAREPLGAKVLLIGPSGIGKTSLLRTVGPDLLPLTIFCDVEAGGMAIADVEVATIRPRTFQDCADLACAIGGPRTDLTPASRYSQAHFEAVRTRLDIERLQSYRLVFLDSLTEVARLSFAAAEASPDCLTDRGRVDLRQVYGAHARQLLGMLYQMQQARGVHVVMVGILECVKDDFGRIDYQPQIEGAKTGRELPGIVDEVITMQWADIGDGKPFRAFFCQPPCPYPAKDRSGKLLPMEEPDLGKLITKLTN